MNVYPFRPLGDTKRLKSLSDCVILELVAWINGYMTSLYRHYTQCLSTFHNIFPMFWLHTKSPLGHRPLTATWRPFIKIKCGGQRAPCTNHAQRPPGGTHSGQRRLWADIYFHGSNMKGCVGIRKICAIWLAVDTGVDCIQQPHLQWVTEETTAWRFWSLIEYAWWSFKFGRVVSNTLLCGVSNSQGIFISTLQRL